jgi:hypothetical protein
MLLTELLALSPQTYSNSVVPVKIVLLELPVVLLAVPAVPPAEVLPRQLLLCTAPLTTLDESQEGSPILESIFIN